MHHAWINGQLCGPEQVPIEGNTSLKYKLIPIYLTGPSLLHKRFIHVVNWCGHLRRKAAMDMDKNRKLIYTSHSDFNALLSVTRHYFRREFMVSLHPAICAPICDLLKSRCCSEADVTSRPSDRNRSTECQGSIRQNSSCLLFAVCTLQEKEKIKKNEIRKCRQSWEAIVVWIPNPTAR